MTTSKIKGLCLSLLDDLFNEYYTIAKHKRILFFVKKVVVPYVRNIVVSDISDEKLKQIVWRQKKTIEQYWDQFERAEQIAETRGMNEGKMQKFVESLPDYKEVMDLIPDIEVK